VWRLLEGVHWLCKSSDHLLCKYNEPIAAGLLLERAHQLDGLACIEAAVHIVRTQTHQCLSETVVPSRIGQAKVVDGVDQHLDGIVMCTGAYGYWILKPAAQQLNEYQSETVQVRGVVAARAVTALGRHVLDAAKAKHLGGRFALYVLESGCAKVEHTEVALGADHYIRGLDVSMNDPERRRHAYGNLEPSCSKGARNGLTDFINGPGGDHCVSIIQGLHQLAKVETVDEFHDDRWTSFDFGNRVDPDNVLMLKARQQLGFVPGAVEDVLGIYPPLFEDLDGNDAAQPTGIRRARQVHLGKSARTSLLQQGDLAAACVGAGHRKFSRVGLMRGALNAAHGRGVASNGRAAGECITGQSNHGRLQESCNLLVYWVPQVEGIGYCGPVDTRCGHKPVGGGVI
jgi:hypothetical protein